MIAGVAPSAPEDPDVTRVSLVARPSLLVARMCRLMPGLKTLRVFWSSESSRADVDELARAGSAVGVAVVSTRVEAPSALPETLRAIKDRGDAFWLMPDPTLVDAANFAVLREYAAASKTPFFAPTEGLAQLGASATLAVPFREMGRVAAAVARARLAGKTVAPVVWADKVVVTVNARAASGCGLAEPAQGAADRTIP